MAYDKSGIKISIDQLTDEQNALNKGWFLCIPEKQKEAKGWFLALFLANKNYPCASLEKITYKDKKKRAIKYE